MLSRGGFAASAVINLPQKVREASESQSCEMFIFSSCLALAFGLMRNFFVINFFCNGRERDRSVWVSLLCPGIARQIGITFTRCLMQPTCVGF